MGQHSFSNCHCVASYLEKSTTRRALQLTASSTRARGNVSRRHAWSVASTVLFDNNPSRPGAPPLDPGLARLLATRRSLLHSAPCLAAIACKPHTPIMQTPTKGKSVKEHRATEPPSGGAARGRRTGPRGVVAAVRRPAAASVVDPAAAANHPVQARGGPLRINCS